MLTTHHKRMIESRPYYFLGANNLAIHDYAVEKSREKYGSNKVKDMLYQRGLECDYQPQDEGMHWSDN